MLNPDNFTQQFTILRHIDVRKLSPLSTDYLAKEYVNRKKSIFTSSDPNINRNPGHILDPGTGWVDADVPRDVDVTQEIMDLTDRFAIAHTYSKGIIQEFKTLAAAEKARQNAVPKFDVSFDIEDEEPVEAAEETQPRGRTQNHRSVDG